MSQDFTLQTDAEGVATITINRPEKRTLRRRIWSFGEESWRTRGSERRLTG